MIRLENITLQYGDIMVIENLNLHIGKKDFYTLLGESGSGKSTLLMAIAGFLKPTQGRIYIDGTDVTDLPPEQRDIGIVFQNYALFPNMSVCKNVAFGLKVRKYSKQNIQDRTEQVLKTVGIWEHAHKKPVALSGGQQQRVAIARAIVLNPKILLMDEPLSNLDAKLRVEMRSELIRLQQQFGFTIVFVTHDQDEALSMSSCVALLNQGKIEQFGKPQDLYYTPATAYACNFLGEACVFSSGLKQALNLPKNAFVAVRPERLPLCNTGNAVDYTIDATITDIVFRGTNALIYATLETGETIHNTLFGHHAISLNIGDTITVGCNKDDLIIILYAV